MIIHSTFFSHKDTYPNLWYIRHSHSQSITIYTQGGIYNGDYFSYITHNTDFSIEAKVL